MAAVFKALGCGDVKRGDANELRAGIRAAVENRDLMLIFDEAHCLFGLSARASIKRLEYLRTELVNRGIPVVLVVTPQFSDRLREMERTTGFNVNQFRGRITKWAELPKKPSRGDVECVCRHLLPGLSDECAGLMIDCAMSADAPLAALNNAVLEARVAAEKAGAAITDPETIRLAIGYSLATRQMLDASIPAPKPARRPSAAPLSTKSQIPVQQLSWFCFLREGDRGGNEGKAVADASATRGSRRGRGTKPAAPGSGGGVVGYGGLAQQGVEVDQ